MFGNLQIKYEFDRRKEVAAWEQSTFIDLIKIKQLCNIALFVNSVDMKNKLQTSIACQIVQKWWYVGVHAFQKHDTIVKIFFCLCLFFLYLSTTVTKRKSTCHSALYAHCRHSKCLTTGGVAYHLGKVYGIYLYGALQECILTARTGM